MKKIFKILFIIPIFIGIIFGIIIATKSKLPSFNEKKIIKNIFGNVQSKSAEVTSLYTYGQSLNIKGKISGISKDNLEGAKLVLTDGFEEKIFALDYEIKDGTLFFDSNQINNNIIIEKKKKKYYYILVRLKLNNSANYRYYSLASANDNNDLEYYTVTKNESNKKLNFEFSTQKYKKKEYSYLKVNLVEAELPENVYDIVIDAGHGGKDSGEKSSGHTEADITLEYAKIMAKHLEEKGLKVKLTRTDENTASYTYTNMYDDNGRITIACESKAKYMVSFHVNNSSLKSANGFEIYCPNNSSLELAKTMANKIKEKTSINYSNSEEYKQADGVYVKNFTKKLIDEFKKTAEQKGYEPYNITTNTPYLYTIREVGGVATNAYVDGRNKVYNANKYYNSNNGIECYQIELGYIKTDLEKILNEKENYVEAIADSLLENIK